MRKRMALLAQLRHRPPLRRQRFARPVVRDLSVGDRVMDPLDLIRRHKVSVVGGPPNLFTRLMDQHAFLQIEEGDDIHVGDMIGFDISHPCLTFDKWRQLLVLDKSWRAIDVVQTYF